MLVILGMSTLFVEDIKEVAISNNNIENFNYCLLREGSYKILLPENWIIEENQPYSDKELEADFSDNKNIEGSIIILERDLEEVIDLVLNEEEGKILRSSNEDWNVVEINKDNYINKYYIKQYSEGKVLIIKYSYKKGKIKNSMKVVFDKISNSFQ
nr:hypothetical protein [Caproiciproducens sp. MSJ-32]